MLSRHFTPLLRSHISLTQRASLSTSTARWSQDSSSSAYREGMARYKLFVSPFAKVFLGAIFTYQVIHWTWLKLEMDESKADKNKEVEALEKKAKELTGAQK
ncbi:hypothetical protein CBS147343_335 [Aspergillus niger]|uniref:Uncharacterized protein n=2 Tax=Aspergillus TaxID=5052 RepID=A0A370PPV8_ASPPH|nr:uncharacterized protein BO96DRAFT_408018 [Aspergillus niger CBS 101883]KAI2818504.1 hypothetical protein CBS133816_10341 [Aspergillus niger]RDK44213.1 hypothetical protein M752DRAFT_334158 [Aspergillus phoenicis ATCC 13157]KAI2839959.1 hypothetical protein CBS11350_7297 [Aspergillus niger]KAI2852534.1 hypothetical protein CBS12448_8239 [Aspergillus niger]KAI2921193.1 hypothetical protein CBS147320_7756 [Aspergillus niger]